MMTYEEARSLLVSVSEMAPQYHALKATIKMNRSGGYDIVDMAIKFQPKDTAHTISFEKGAVGTGDFGYIPTPTEER